ncbi:toxic anion resistance protein [Mesorhizobium sp.]|uniref:toxic anion resistance protein n=1 Tax=Mesorhizobium sp. TaxID=1871066 RepID=UPI0025D5CBD6|nr:toxic anion resistance protein [Mesorhizobium sp.]
MRDIDTDTGIGGAGRTVVMEIDPALGSAGSNVTQLRPETPTGEAKTSPAKGVEGAPGDAPAKKGGRKRFAFLIAGLVVLAGAGWYGYNWWINGRFIVSTDDAYVQAGKKFVDDYRANELPKLKAVADKAGGDAGGTLEAQTYQDAVQALDRLEKRVFYLVQARQLGIQQLPQIRIVQSGDETLIENLQATSALTVPAWKQKMVILLGLTNQKSALELQKTVTDATNEMIRQTSKMMKDQAISIEEQAQRGIVDVETLAQANRDLIDTVQGVLKVQQEGRQKRADAEKQMDQMTLDLKKALTQS